MSDRHPVVTLIQRTANRLLRPTHCRCHVRNRYRSARIASDHIQAFHQRFLFVQTIFFLLTDFYWSILPVKLVMVCSLLENVHAITK